MWGAYFCMGAYKHDVVVVIKNGCLYSWVLILCVLSRFYSIHLGTSYLHSYACHVSIITLHKSIMTGLLPVLVQNFFKLNIFMT